MIIHVKADVVGSIRHTLPYPQRSFIRKSDSCYEIEQLWYPWRHIHTCIGIQKVQKEILTFLYSLKI